jgi:hypothetical protein
MAGLVINVIIGLFIWMLLPRLLHNKRKYQKNSPQYFAHISCKIIGIAIIAIAILNFLKRMLS